MTRLIIQHLWSDFKKHWLGILLILGLCYIGTAFVLTFGLWFFIIDSQAYLLSDAELKEIILNGSEVYTLVYFIYTARNFTFCHTDFQKVSCPAAETHFIFALQI